MDMHAAFHCKMKLVPDRPGRNKETSWVGDLDSMVPAATVLPTPLNSQLCPHGKCGDQSTEDEKVCAWLKDLSAWGGDSSQRWMAVALQTHSEALKDHSEEKFFQRQKCWFYVDSWGSGSQVGQLIRDLERILFLGDLGERQADGALRMGTEWE